MSRRAAARALVGMARAQALVVLVSVSAASCATRDRVAPPPTAPGARVEPAPFASHRIAAGEGHACVIRADDGVWCWGRDAIGMSRDELAPRRVPGTSGATHLMAHDGADCAETPRGLVCWGDNLHGQVEATPSLQYVREPVEMLTLDGAVARHGALGPGGGCLLSPEHVECRGNVGRPWRAPHTTRFGEIPEAAQGKSSISGAPTTASRRVPGIDGATQLALGVIHLCALMRDRTVRCLGDASVGQLGRMELDHERSHPAAEVPGLRDVVQLEAGLAATCARTASGDVWCWGSDFHGHIAARDPGRLVPVIRFVTIPGDPHDRFAPFPVRVEGLPPSTQLSVGATHACAIGVDREVRCWGANGAGQLGDGTTERRDAPVTMNGARGALDVAASSYGPKGHTCVLFDGGVVRCVGRAESGVLGRDQKEHALGLTEVAFR